MLVALAVAPASALAQRDVAVQVFNDFATDGRIDPCKHTSSQLEAVKRNIPPDIEQYAPDYPAAVDAALKARARGDCARKKSSATPPPVTPSATAAPPGPSAPSGSAAPAPAAPDAPAT